MAFATFATLAQVAPGIARADPPPLTVGLSYDERSVPSDCPRSDELRAAITSQLGYDPFVDVRPPPSLEVRVAIEQRGTGTEARIEWLSSSGEPQGERRLSSESRECAEIARGVAFAVAVQLELWAVSPPSAVAEPPPPPKPAPAPPARPPPPKPARQTSERAVLVGAGVFAQRGLQPSTALGFRTSGSLRGSSWSLGLEALMTLPSEWRSEEGAGFSANVLGLGLAPCLRFAPIDACALGTLGQLSVRGQGVDRARSPSTAWGGLGVRLQLSWPERGRLATVLHLDAWAPLTPREVLVNRAVVWATAPVVVAAGLDLAAVFQ